MLNKKMRLLAVLLFCMTVFVFAQDAGLEDGIFSPFVTQLTAETRNNLVRLSWTDSRDVRGPVYVFRSAYPFTGPETSALRPVEIPYGTQSYVDETEGAGSFYYFVAASDAGGQRYDIFIPYTNTATAFFTAPSLMENQNQPSVSQRTASNQNNTENIRPSETAISSLTAIAEGEGIILSFTASGTPKSTVLYRNTQPITRIQDLLSAVIVQSGIISPFIDYPAPGAAFYYALLFEEDISRGTVQIQPGRNATINPVMIGARIPDAPAGMRSMPLPSLSIQRTSPGSDIYSEAPIPVPLRSETVSALDRLQSSSRAVSPNPPPPKRPRVFARDLEVPSGGEESILRTIVQGPFITREWQSAQDDLLLYLSLPRTAATEARARFYLGQTYYYAGKNRDALIEFLFVQARYPEEANEWIEAVLTAMAY